MTGELPEHFMYSSYIYEMIYRSRQQTISTLVGGKQNTSYVNLSCLKESVSWFLERREKFTEIQKEACDEYEFAMAMKDVF